MAKQISSMIMKARMSTERKLLGASGNEVETADYTDNSMMLRRYSFGQEAYSEEARNDIAYKAYKQDLGDLCEPDYELEKDFFRQRELTISDFDGTNTIVTPAASPVPKSHVSIKKRLSAETVGGHSAPQLIESSTRFVSPSRYQIQEKTYTNQTTQTSSFHSDAEQKPTFKGTIAWPFSDTYPTPEKVSFSQNGSSESIYSAQDTESNEDVRSCKQCADYLDMIDALVQAGCDTSYDVGAKFIVVGHHIHLENTVDTKARVASETAQICDSPIPELDLDDDADSVASSEVAEFSYDASPGTLHFFSQAGVHVTTRDLQDDFVSAQSTNLAGGYLDIDQNAEDEKAQVNIDFFSRRPPPKTSSDFRTLSFASDHRQSHDISPYGTNSCVNPGDQGLVPAVVDDLADPDYYLGPGAPAPDDSIFDTIYRKGCHAQENIIEDQADSFTVVNAGRCPESSLLSGCADRNSDASNQSLPLLLPLTYSGEESKCLEDPMIDVTLTSTQIFAPQTSKIPNYGESFLVKKRPARESFDLIELCKENDQREFASKKPRLASHLSDLSVQIPPTPTSAVSSVFAYSPMATALQGYTGQFEIHLPESLSNIKASAEQHVFGSHLHANGEIINTHFVADTSCAGQDLSDSPNLRPSIEHGYLHHCFAEEMPRTDEEERLRKEAHRECSAARLEGVPVGYYRYYAGHMTVEEYVDARLCVCWDRCFCSKLCTRFGDLACPCAEHLIVGDD